jgi:NTP pyrophosphatase (non-canonical NTP hydrolase)
MSNLADITDYLIRFRDERHWAQFHNSKDLAIALSIEAAELNEIFLWKKDTEIEDIERVEQQKIADELADVLVYALMFAHRNGFDVEKIIMDKMKKNGEKYPVEKARGNSKKYTEL